MFARSRLLLPDVGNPPQEAEQPNVLLWTLTLFGGFLEAYVEIRSREFVIAALVNDEIIETHWYISIQPVIPSQIEEPVERSEIVIRNTDDFALHASFQMQIISVNNNIHEESTVARHRDFPDNEVHYGWLFDNVNFSSPPMPIYAYQFIHIRIYIFDIVIDPDFDFYDGFEF